MDADTLLLAGKALLGFGLPLAFGVHQLWSLRRERRSDAAQTGQRSSR